MAVSRVPGSRKLFDYAGLQARRKRCSRNPQLEVLDDRVPPYPLSFSATPMLLAIVPTAMLTRLRLRPTSLATIDDDHSG